MTIATDLGVARSTARGWLGAAPTVVVGLEVAGLTEAEGGPSNELYRHERKYFYRVDAWFRFTDDGIVEMSRGPLAHGSPSTAGSLRLRGDYQIVGHNVVIGFDDEEPGSLLPYVLHGLRLTCDELEFISGAGVHILEGRVWVGTAPDSYVLRRE